MRRLTGLELSPADCELLAPVLARAARAVSAPADADVLRRYAVGLAAERPMCGQCAANAGQVDDRPVTLGEWADEHRVSLRTARRAAANGQIPGAVKINRRWTIRPASARSSISPPSRSANPKPS